MKSTNNDIFAAAGRLIASVYGGGKSGHQRAV